MRGKDLTMLATAFGRDTSAQRCAQHTLQMDTTPRNRAVSEARESGKRCFGHAPIRLCGCTDSETVSRPIGRHTSPWLVEHFCNC